ncbi:MAG: hypothetical protein EB075_12080, partial [Bacteroidetes bacterium]|nr:hypothetical protein [Bacteroidota bacterium]
MVPFPEHVVQADGTIQTAGERQAFIWLSLKGAPHGLAQDTSHTQGEGHAPYALQISLTPEQLG